MGQRSQLFIRYAAAGAGGAVETRREAMYLHNNWGPFMLQRAAQLVKILDLHAEHGQRYPTLFAHEQAERVRGLRAVFAVNQETGVVEGLHPFDDVSNEAVGHIDNNNGAMFVDIDATGGYSICFATGSDLHHGTQTPRTAREYLTAEHTLTPTGEVVEYYEAITDQIERNLAVLEACENGHLMDEATLSKHWSWRPVATQDACA